MTERPYVPISCSAHDELLARATLQQECELVVREESGAAERVRGIILDVYSRGRPSTFACRADELFALTTFRVLTVRLFLPRKLRP
jgi:hypothetical protein